MRPRKFRSIQHDSLRTQTYFRLSVEIRLRSQDTNTTANLKWVQSLLFLSITLEHVG